MPSMPDLYTLYPVDEAESGNWFVRKDHDAQTIELGYTNPPDPRTFYVWRNDLWVFDTYWEFGKEARGDVLIVGVELGFACLGIDSLQRVSTVTVVDRDFDNLALAEPITDMATKTTVVHQGVGPFLRSTQQTFDTIFCQILRADINLMPRAKAKFLLHAEPLLNPEGKILFWGSQRDDEDLIG